MACNTLNLTSKTWAGPNQQAVIDDMEDNDLDSATPTAQSIPGDRRLLLESALKQVLQSDGSQIVIALDGRTDPTVGFTLDPISTAVKALLLPLSWEKLVARVQSALRQANAHTIPSLTRFGEVCIDFLSMEVSRSGEQVVLTAQEFKTLKFFLANPGRVISRDELLNEAWGYDNYPYSRTVDNHVLKLRQKLEIDPSHPVHFRTVHRVGYKFVF
ncbi:MAG TPA: response regulator transcription factor [Terriglobales bacterium]|nr:response regulator transcription factor [Terriglobales bacterium]